MNRKHFVILLVMVALVGGAGLMVYRKQQSAWSSGGAGPGTTLLSNLSINDVVRLRIQQGTNTVNLVRQDDRWRVQERHDYPANFSSISDFLIKVRDLKAVQAEKVGPSQWPRLQLASDGQGTNAPTIIEFRGEGDKTLGSLWLGKMHLSARRGGPMGGGEGGFPDGRYVKIGADADTVALIADPLDQIQPDPADWLNKDFFKVERAKLISVRFGEATNSWQIMRETETADWQLAHAGEGEKLDSAKAGGFYSPLSAPTFNDVLGKADGTAKLPTTVTVETFDGFRYEVSVGEKLNEAYPATVNVSAEFAQERAAGAEETPEDKQRLDGEFAERTQKLTEKLKQEQACAGWTYLVPTWVLDPLIKTRAELLAGEEPVSAAIPDNVPVHQHTEADDHAGHNHP